MKSNEPVKQGFFFFNYERYLKLALLAISSLLFTCFCRGRGLQDLNPG